jgi:PIN domain nuclease of toxin-antitoxin system
MTLKSTSNGFAFGYPYIDIQKLIDLDFHHRDPFDRIIIAQGLVEKMTIVTKDENFPKYGVQLIWD